MSSHYSTVGSGEKRGSLGARAGAVGLLLRCYGLVEALRLEHNELQEKHTAAAEESERNSKDLQSKIDEMEAAEKHRLEIQAAMEAAEAAMPAPPVASIAVAAPPPPAPAAENFAAAAGGFSL